MPLNPLSQDFAPNFETKVLVSLERLTTEMHDLREDVSDLKESGEKRDEVMNKLKENVQSRDHARQTDFVAVDLKTIALTTAVAAVQIRIQTLEDKSEKRIQELAQTAGHRITILEQKSWALKGGYAATLGFAAVVAFLFEVLYHALDLGKFLFKK